MFNFIKRYIKRNYGIDKEYYRFIDDMFGFIPNNIELYKVALIHKSASQSIGGHHINNERLEYLGDAVIETITSDYLFIAYPDQNEGFLTQMRSKIVSRQSLNEMAVFIGLDKYLICKSGVALQQKHIYGDAFEAMMGAIYLDKGYEFTNRLLINDIYEKFLSIDELSCSESDYKSRLIEWCQKNRHSLEFKTSRELNKKSSTPVFYTTVFIDHIETGHGIGDSKKSAEQNAACSVTREMSDEECARLLDRIDKLLEHTDANEQTAEPKQQKQKQQKHNRKNRHDTPAEQPAVEDKAAETAEKPENTETEIFAEVAEVTETVNAVEADKESTSEEQPQPSVQPKRRRRGSRKITQEPVQEETPEVAEAAASEHVEATAEPSAESEVQPVKKRRGRRKKSEAATAEPSEAEASAEVPAEEGQNVQPAKKRRGRRKKSEQAAAESSAAADSSEPTSEPAADANVL